MTGESAESTLHLARSSIHFLAGGHYATETFGIKALAGSSRPSSIDWEFVDVPVPVCKA